MTEQFQVKFLWDDVLEKSWVCYVFGCLYSEIVIIYFG